jgi:hypothetical protein
LRDHTASPSLAYFGSRSSREDPSLQGCTEFSDGFSSRLIPESCARIGALCEIEERKLVLVVRINECLFFHGEASLFTFDQRLKDKGYVTMLIPRGLKMPVYMIVTLK